MIAKIWNETSKEVLRNAWKKLKIDEPVPPAEEVYMPMQNIIPRHFMDAWAADPELDPGWEVLTNEQIIDLQQQTIRQREQQQEIESEPESESDPDEFNAKSVAEAARLLRGFYLKKGEPDMARKMSEAEQQAIEMIDDSQLNARQSTLDTFFT